MLETFLVNQTAVFVLVLARVGGVVATAPLFSSEAMPLRARGLLAIALSMLAAPLVGGPLSVDGLDVLAFGRMVLGETIIGLLLGLGVTVVLSGVQVAGQMVSQVSGMAIGDVFNPELNNTTSVFTQLFYFLTLTVFVLTGGHRMVFDALMRTFEWAPPGQARFGESYTEAMLEMLSLSFELGVRASAPIVTALFLSTIILGLISRTLPQINAIVVGFNVNSLLTLAVMMLSLGGVAWTFQEPLAGALDTLAAAVREGGIETDPLP